MRPTDNNLILSNIGYAWRGHIPHKTYPSASSRWFQMSRCHVGARLSATTMVTRQKYSITWTILHNTHRVPECSGGREPFGVCLLVGSSPHSNTASWSLVIISTDKIVISAISRNWVHTFRRRLQYTAWKLHELACEEPMPSIRLTQSHQEICVGTKFMQGSLVLYRPLPQLGQAFLQFWHGCPQSRALGKLDHMSRETTSIVRESQWAWRSGHRWVVRRGSPCHGLVWLIEVVRGFVVVFFKFFSLLCGFYL